MPVKNYDIRIRLTREDKTELLRRAQASEKDLSVYCLEVLKAPTSEELLKLSQRVERLLLEKRNRFQQVFEQRLREETSAFWADFEKAILHVSHDAATLNQLVQSHQSSSQSRRGRQRRFRRFIQRLFIGPFF